MPPDEDVDVFIAYTPYNALLSHCIAAEISDGKQYLYLVPAFDTNAAKSLVTLLKNGGAFDRVVQLRGKFDGSTKRNKVEAIRNIPKNISQIRREIKEFNLRRTFAAVDTKEVVQAIMSDSKKNIAIEDGGAAYTDAETGWVSISGHKRINKLYHFIHCRFWWESISVYGTSSYIDEFRAVYPNQVRVELANHPIRTIDPDPLWELTGKTYFDQYLTKFGITREEFSDESLLLLLPSSSRIESNKKLKKVLTKIHTHFRQRSDDVLIKSHPRDEQKADIILNMENDFRTVPAKIPVELVYAMCEDTIQTAIGNQSTSVYTAKLLCPKSKVISYGPLITPENHLFNMFRNIGVELLNDAAELPEIL